MTYQVTYAIDSLDPNPVVMTFETEWEATEWLHDEVYRRVSHAVEHSAWGVSEYEYQDLEEAEYSLARIDRV